MLESSFLANFSRKIYYIIPLTAGIHGNAFHHVYLDYIF